MTRIEETYRGATRPVPITDEMALVVNRATAYDGNVVISFTVTEQDIRENGSRQAIGLSPEDARRMAVALIEAAEAVGG